ncbi:hypothetical protein K466DRAFT_392529 [Polyporus arcularius HHB13444]|uniref:Uncharacterized protein n=1 Tax=Polyporus arcularius HHB13444 TaxID=1314778 RepID=A0A5C3NRW5_9APHY|nr:hypothetical protein K466DRAFT_392529 [Polyporus arcularius HHB13444]
MGEMSARTKRRPQFSCRKCAFAARLPRRSSDPAFPSELASAQSPAAIPSLAVDRCLAIANTARALHTHDARRRTSDIDLLCGDQLRAHLASCQSVYVSLHSAVVLTACSLSKLSPRLLRRPLPSGDLRLPLLPDPRTSPIPRPAHDLSQLQITLSRPL